MADSFLDRRLRELRAGEREVPLDYETLREQAREALASRHFDYVAAGAGTGDTMRANRAAFRRYRIVRRVLRDISERDLGIELFGRELPAPVVLAPVGGQGRYDPAAECATARAAGELGVPVTVSSAATRSIEDIAAANGAGSRYFQLYWPTDRAVAESLVARAAAADYDAIVLTVDSQLPKWRRRVLRGAEGGTRDTPRGVFETDPAVRELAEAAGEPIETFIRTSPALAKDTTLTWTDLDALHEWTDLPVVLKGILAPTDARRAADWGADGVVVSNHGGRQIDGEVAALDQLPAVVDAVSDETTVLFDSGVRTGADVFTALALGADAVLLGRPYVYGLAAAGQRGVYETTLNCLAELESVMGLAGRPTVGAIGRDALVGPVGDGPDDRRAPGAIG